MEDDVPVSDLERLREIRDLLRECDAMKPERDGLIREAAKSNSERAVAVASGLSQQRVHEIATR